MRGKDLPDPLQWADQLDDFLKSCRGTFATPSSCAMPKLLTGFMVRC